MNFRLMWSVAQEMMKQVQDAMTSTLKKTFQTASVSLITKKDLNHYRFGIIFIANPPPEAMLIVNFRSAGIGMISFL